MKQFAVLFGILGLDAATKMWAEKTLPLKKEKEIIKDTLYLQHIKNTGFAYHTFAGEKNFILTITGALTAMYTLVFLKSLKKTDENHRASFALALTLGGAYGNFMERMTKGQVTDFIFIKKGKNPPIFNVADVALLLGSLWVLLVSLCKTKKKDEDFLL